jgi:hypothetical protein
MESGRKEKNVVGLNLKSKWKAIKYRNMNTVMKVWKSMDVKVELIASNGVVTLIVL